jgi:DNA-binding XRE family transcriptional regulator
VAQEGEQLASNNLQQLREQRMMSKAELARKSGLSTLTINRVEAGRPCRLETKRKILNALQLGVTDQERVFGPPLEGELEHPHFGREAIASSPVQVEER